MPSIGPHEFEPNPNNVEICGRDRLSKEHPVHRVEDEGVPVREVHSITGGKHSIALCNHPTCVEAYENLLASQEGQPIPTETTDILNEVRNYNWLDRAEEAKQRAEAVRDQEESFKLLGRGILELREVIENDMINRFKHHPPKNEATVKAHAVIRAECLKMSSYLMKYVPPGRELNMALTNLEQVMFWANAGIARD